MPLVNGPFDDFTSKILQIVNSTLPKKLHQKNLENKITKARSILGARDALELLQLLTVSGPIRDQPVLGYQGSGLTLPKIKSDLPLGQAFALHDQQNYLPSNVLVKSDRCGMAHKLELRAPFLSAALRDFANSLPISHKIHNGQGKYILRKLLENQTPKDISTAPKAGFDTPLTSWLINDLGTLVNDTLARENIERYNVLDANIVNARVAELYQGRVQNAQWVWNVFSLQRWQEKWMQ
jgi:asparagine synthase (glutamine-hydrolysing)